MVIIIKEKRLDFLTVLFWARSPSSAYPGKPLQAQSCRCRVVKQNTNDIPSIRKKQIESPDSSHWVEGIKAVYPVRLPLGKDSGLFPHPKMSMSEMA